ncbi:putative DsbA family dithiol-disulfide isomerase [Hoeflea marina]|uniref:Putative DsbA family dithiol-disulfide isomerase n=1 Tax=Hoeflea marina TaxID=274592 RepID=A0A317PX84_9HYPH|nr:DsbA family oxidoreductase [Hoeflea marina]PWW04110.1 putative DsbA family dithiol-disulfide isomerase [Hoeflea marina]
MSNKPLSVDIVSDVMCPWCYIGKRRLEQALAGIGGAFEVDIRWRPYQLDPTLPKAGKDRRRYLEDKFGGPDGATQAYRAVRQAAQDDGIDFDFDAIEVSANTLDAHRLIRWAGSEGSETQGKVVDALFRMYFEDGRNIGDDAVLIEAAADAGMDRAVIATLLKGDADRAEVRAEIDMAREMGVTGVPCFIIDNKYAVMGAQPADTLEDALREIFANRHTEAGESATGRG